MENCGLNNVICAHEEYTIPNSVKKIYCKAPDKITSDDTVYDIIHSGCSLEPVEAIVSSSVQAGLQADNIGSSVNYSGSTSDPASTFREQMAAADSSASAEAASREGYMETPP